MSRLKRSGDRERFEDVYRDTRVRVLGYLLRRTENREDAADLLADVYLIAWRRIRDVPNGEEARLWLFGVARRVLANHHRKKRSETGLASALQTNLRLVEVHSCTPDGDLSTGPVLTALAALDERDRELLLLSAWEELSPSQIAKVVGRPAGLVRVQLHRARKRLGERIANPVRHGLPRSEPVELIP
jgi:RNA polymerase sigma-70 factor (ECF subfamily)